MLQIRETVFQNDNNTYNNMECSQATTENLLWLNMDYFDV